MYRKNIQSLAHPVHLIFFKNDVRVYGNHNQLSLRAAFLFKGEYRGDCISQAPQNPIFKIKYELTLTFLPKLCAGNFSTIMLLAPCSFK